MVTRNPKGHGQVRRQTRVVGVALPFSLANILDEVCRRQDRTASAVVRRILAQGLPKIAAETVSA